MTEYLGKYYEHLTPEDIDNEEWCDVSGYEGLYQVSSCGRVKSLARTKLGKGGCVLEVKERILKAGLGNHGYLFVCLYKDNKNNTPTIHRLVANEFIANTENKPEVNHLNGKTDNRVCSLEWVTPKDNIAHAIETGLMNNVGENNGRCKLTDNDCELIKIKYATGKYTQKELGEEYGVTPSNISIIVNNKSRSRQTPQIH